MAVVRSDQSVAWRLGLSCYYLLDVSPEDVGLVYIAASLIYVDIAGMGDGLSNLWPSHWSEPKLDRSGEVAACGYRFRSTIARGVDDYRSDCRMATEASLII